MTQDFKKLHIWLRSKDLAVQIYYMTKKFPAAEKYNTISQLRRAATSVPTNIAEGASKPTMKDFRKFLFNA